MVFREIKEKLLSLLGQYPAINISGPRQSGKTTLVKEVLGTTHRYYSLEDPDTRLLAAEDPRSFLHNAGERFVLDEVQHVPSLFSYLMQHLDNSTSNGKVVLLGSQSFLMNEHISQTLAGRVANLKLLPFSYSELKGGEMAKTHLDSVLFEGGYPRLHKEGMHPTDFFPHYTETYLQRDVRQIGHVGNLHHFNRFMKLCAGRVGNVLNLSALANDADVAVNTVKSWLSVLEASYIIFFVQPYSGNINRRLIKMPKLYFYDTGLACSLLNIERESQLSTFYMRGNLFENMVFSELLKNRYNKGLPSNLYYLRDAKGNEVDCVVEKAGFNIFVEIKAAETVSLNHLKNITLFRKANPAQQEDYVVYAGADEPTCRGVKYCRWQNLEMMGL